MQNKIIEFCFEQEEIDMCEHSECPYKYCPYHQNYDDTLEVICEFVIPNIEFGRTPKTCMSYLDS